MKKYVVDTSVVVERLVSKLLNEKKIKGLILIPNAVVAELEHQANKGQEIGFSGLEEIQELRKKAKIEFVGGRPKIDQIRLAKSGEIDSLIIDLAVKENAVLITADLVQAESGKAFGLQVIYFEPKKFKERLEFEKYFDDKTMSIHIVEDCFVFGKKGKPGEWKLVKISKDKLDKEKVQDISKEIMEKVRIHSDGFVEISRRSSTIIQYKNYRIVIVRPPVADGWEITVVKPLKKLSIKDYKLGSELRKRLEEKARGIIIAGEPGAGKSTFAQALGEHYLSLGRIVKTVESPRDLQLPDDVTQYSKSFATGEEIHDILFLSRPDNIIFDEMRDTPDFELYGDLRLAGSECIGVIHSSSPIDAVQRFITRLDVGMVPSVIDTILFVDKGKIGKILSLKMSVKVPTGMTESDLARPVVDVCDFISGKLEYEIYSYGDQTVIIPVNKQKKKKGMSKLAEKEIKKEIMRVCGDVKVEVIDENRAEIYVPKEFIGELIGKKGQRIEKIEEKLGISLGVKELEYEREELDFQMQEDKKLIKIFTEPGYNVEVYASGEFLFSAISSKKGVIKVHKKSNVGRELLRAKGKIEVKGLR